MVGPTAARHAKVSFSGVNGAWRTSGATVAAANDPTGRSGVR